MLWVLLWVVLVAAAVAVLGLLARKLWRQARALGREMAQATTRLEQVASQLEDLQTQDVPATGRPGHREPDPRTR